MTKLSRKIDTTEDAAIWLGDLARTQMAAVQYARMAAEGQDCPPDTLIGELLERHTTEAKRAMFTRVCHAAGISEATVEEMNQISWQRRKALTDRACVLLGITTAGRRAMGLE